MSLIGVTYAHLAAAVVLSGVMAVAIALAIWPMQSLADTLGSIETIYFAAFTYLALGGGGPSRSTVSWCDSYSPRAATPSSRADAVSYSHPPTIVRPHRPGHSPPALDDPARGHYICTRRSSVRDARAVKGAVTLGPISAYTADDLRIRTHSTSDQTGHRRSAGDPSRECPWSWSCSWLDVVRYHVSCIESLDASPSNSPHSGVHRGAHAAGDRGSLCAGDHVSLCWRR